MRYYYSLDAIRLNSALVTIGTFDGVHLGHQEIIQRLVSTARLKDSPSVVVTFYPHPAIILGKRSQPLYLTSPEEKAGLLGQMGIDHVLTLAFSMEMAKLSAREFIDLLYSRIKFSHLLIGYDFALGRNRQGDETALRDIGLEVGYTVEAIPALHNSHEIVSSSRIREYLFQGQVEQAAALLGRHYSIVGTVIPGDGRGRTLGIPTANLDIWIEKAIPRNGVYACIARVDEDVRIAVVNIGVRPTFEPQSTTQRVEAHLLDYRADLYGRELRLEFAHFLRPEKRFSGIDELVSQIKTDIGRARELIQL